jgi:glycosyltransferase involved in cell wall biosynthesis
VAFLGRLVPYKGADMLLEAAEPLVRAGRVRVDVIGDGPERERLEARVEARGLGAGVHLHGWIAHDRVREALGPCHVLGFPSIREFGGGVVLEAMALGLVPLVVDYAGPAELVTDETGVRVPLGPREAIVASLRDALQEMLRRPETLSERGARARERALRYFSWDAKAGQVLEVYRWVLGERPGRPDFGMPLGAGADVAGSPSGGES